MDAIQHVESLRRKPDYYWPGKIHSYVQQQAVSYLGNVPSGFCFRPSLNLRTLISLLSPEETITEDVEEEPDEPSTSTPTSRKRKRSDSPSLPAKRARLDEEEFDWGSELDEGKGLEDDEVEYRQIYPSYWDECSGDVINELHSSENTTFLQAYQRNLILRYNKAYEDDSDCVNDKYAKRWGWLKEEEKLFSLLQARSKDQSLPQVIDVGRFYMARYLDRYLALSAQFEQPDDFCSETIRDISERWLLLLPDIPWPDGITAETLAQHDIQPTGGHQDFLTACAVFQGQGRAKLEANLKLHVLPAGTYDHACELPFELRAHFSLSLALPKIYEPFNHSLTQRVRNELEGLQLRLISFLSRSPLTDPVCCGAANEVADVTIPFFLGIMRPAPPLPLGVTYELLQPDGLQATLLPFQRRTVAWMLEREGKRITPEGTVVPLIDSGDSSSNVASSSSPQDQPLPLFWQKIDVGGQGFFFNRLTSAVSSTLPEPHSALGGILAEEPGLGKTMECLALMLLNPAPERNPSNQRWDPEAHLHVKEIKTTLIVTPPALAAQWADELAAHAPDLRVFVYDGWAKVGVPVTEADVEAERERRLSAANRRAKSNGKRNGKGKSKILVDEDVEMVPNPDDPILDWPNFINQFDVCITTYNVLRADITVARAPPKRPRRQDVEYKNVERPRSPLVMCEWHRVIMDEVQMMGTGRSEEMVSLIPRLSSFAVSGTPARAQASDLIRVLRFLRIDDLVAPTRIWNRLLKHGFKDQFVAFFQKYSVRTLKSSVQDELTIPHQQRYLVGIELGRVERHVYDQALEESLAELGLDARGVAGYEGWEVDASVLRNVLRRLRGICTHPQVGQPRQDKLFKPGVLKSMADVLEAMREQNWRNLMEDRRAKVLALTRLAQLQQHQSDDLDRYQRALERVLAAETEANQLIDEVKAAIAQHNVKGDALKKEAQALRDSRKINVPANGHPVGSLDKGKGKEVEDDPMNADADADSDEDEDEDVEDRGLPNTPAGDEHRGKRIALLARLRECLMVLHRVKFLQGDVYHVLGSSYSEKEDAAYGDAESLRKDLLKSTEETASRAMRRLSVDTTEKKVTEQALQIELPFLSGGGIRSTHLFDEANEIIEDVLNEQSALLWEWRSKIVGLLSQKLNSAGEQADGEEYSRTLDTQGEAEVWLQAYTSLLADRRETIVLERTLLAAHEGREKKTRKTKAALAAGRSQDRDDEQLEVPEDVEVQPEHEVLHKQLLQKRKELQIDGRALKSVMVDLSAVAAHIPKDTDPEKIIAKDGTAMLRKLTASQLKLMDRLDADLAQLRKLFNDRIVYFRQLQEISDTVMEVTWEGPVAAAMEVTSKDYTDLGTKINTGRARQRYLDHLATQGGTGTAQEDAECILCQCEFTRGFITQCAHVFCEGCMKLWIPRGQGRACPVCRSPIDPNQLQRFVIHDEQPPPQKPIMANGEPVPVSWREIRYNMIEPSLFADIQMMESNGSYGSKIQSLVRHLLHIQLVDPGSKSIVFSAWADSLTIIEHALLANQITYLRLDHSHGKGKVSGAKKFRVDPYLQVLLLHGERDNAGLNVTCASRVFLVESVVNHGFEVQAIARIDRMGQTRPTEVFCYYAEETVEKNILDLAARQGLSLYTKDNSGGSLNVTSFAMDSQKKLVDSPRKGKKGQPAQKGDFIFKVNDMLAILFPHMFEDIEFLLPPDAEQESLVNPQRGNARPPARRVHVNAEAGPSRVAAA